ncbi:MAG TPA: asparagine synthetase B, partial [Polyangiaceae bacterium]
MCGIAGIVGIDIEAARPALDAMLRAIAHRGPDAHRTESVSLDANEAPIALAHARLAIIDLSTDGVQPMTDAEGDLTIVFNGEIYNYRELRSELEGKGHRFRTASDTEVIVRAHREWGLAAVERLRGMFAYAIVDRRTKQITFVRDRLGIKPLYFARARGGLVFASEVRSIVASGFVESAFDRAALES